MNDSLPGALGASERNALGFPVVGVGASAGGLEALTTMFERVPRDIGIAFIVVQHLDPDHESMMAELVGRRTSLQVRQVRPGDRVAAGCVHVIPPGFALQIRAGELILTDFSEPRGVRRPIDDFFVSLAQDQQNSSACVILSGTGSDGAFGLRAIKERGGVCVAQSPETAKYDGMPMAAVGTGLVDFVVAAEEIVGRLKAFFDHRLAPGALVEGAAQTADHIDDVCFQLRETLGHDFGGYKRSTVVRRIERRMQILGVADPAEYVKRIRGDENECQALFRDMLINVTNFFRDPDLFEVLAKRAIEPLVAASVKTDPIRVWIPGCSSGEEAYTIAMLFREAAEAAESTPIVQIFATDIDEQMLSIAREGRYPANAIVDIPERLRLKYLSFADSQFIVAPAIRDMVRFSAHSLIRDPPFSRLDLISCRNLLIYMGEAIQSALIPLMHYSLRAGGFLFLGPSEGVSRRDDLFAAVDQKARVYRRRDVAASYPIQLPSRGRVEQRAPRLAPVQERPNDEFPIYANVASRRILESYAPPSLLVDSEGVILEAHGRLAKYFEFHGGRRQEDIVTAARRGLRETLAPLLRAVTERRARIARKGIEVVSEFGRQTITLVADPLPDGHILFVIIESAPFAADFADDYLDASEAEDQTHFLEEELRVLRHRLRTTTEELETTNEELKSSNEEMMSMNEELQSTNEELTTVNDELKSKIELLGVLNDDLTNFLDSTDLAVVVVDKELRIRTFTPRARNIFPLTETDRGRLLTDVASLVTHVDLNEAVRPALDSGETTSHMIEARDGSAHYHLRILPYRTFQGAIQGATLTFSDVSDLKTIQNDLADHRERLQLALDVSSMGVWHFDPATKEVVVDETTRRVFGLPVRESHALDTVIACIFEKDRPTVTEALDRAIKTQSQYSAVYRIGQHEDQTRWVKGAGRFMRDTHAATRLVGVVFDVTVQQRADHSRELLLREMNHRVKNSFAVASALVHGALRSATSIDGLAAEVNRRISALARAHDTTQAPDEAAARSLRKLAEAIVDAYRDRDRIEFGEGDLLIPYEIVTPLGLILHEWMTNAAKYGALSHPEGRLSIGWTLLQSTDRPDEVKIVWRETVPDGAGLEAKEGLEAKAGLGGAQGFGSRLIDAMARQLDGRLSSSATPTGYRNEISFPLTRA